MPSTPLDELLARLGRGDAAAFTEIVARYGRLVLGVARALRLEPNDVEDVAQITWGTLVDHAATIRDPDALPSWLARTARNEAIRVARLRGRELLLETPVEVIAPLEPSDLELREVERERAELALAVRGAVAALPERDRQLVVFLLAFPEASYREIAEALAMPVGSIGPIRQRALRRLRAALEARGISGALAGSHE